MIRLKHVLWLLSGALLFAACDHSGAKIEPVAASSNIDAYNETEVSSGLLSGTFLNAGAGAPIIVIVPGSGPTDRDGNNGEFISNVLKFLAQDLADKNISSIRVDKYGMFGSAAAGDGNSVTVETYAEDYRAWTKKAVALSGQNCAFLLGHSEGGLMVSAAAAGQDNVCGIITVAAPGRGLNMVLREQLKSNPANGPIISDAERAIKALESGKKIDVSKFHPALKGMFYPQVQDYLISLFAVDPAAVLAEAHHPALVIQGEHDIQVSVKDAKRLAETSGAKIVLIPKLNHVLKPAPKARRRNIKTYKSPNVPIDPRVAAAVADFVDELK